MIRTRAVTVTMRVARRERKELFSGGIKVRGTVELPIFIQLGQSESEFLLAELFSLVE